MKALTLTGGILVAACVAIGCSESTEQRAREAGQEAAEAARAAGETVVSAAQDAVNTAERAGDSVQKASERTDEAEASLKQVGDAAAGAVQTVQVKGALVADSTVDASGIDVDTDARTKTITLKGHVPSAAQKTAAGRIATAKASAGYSVRNDLVVTTASGSGASR